MNLVAGQGIQPAADNCSYLQISLWRASENCLVSHGNVHFRDQCPVRERFRLCVFAPAKKCLFALVQSERDPGFPVGLGGGAVTPPLYRGFPRSSVQGSNSFAAYVALTLHVLLHLHALKDRADYIEGYRFMGFV